MKFRFCALALLLAGASLQAQTTEEGTLELLWGDAAPGSSQPARFEVNLVDASGTRRALDTDSALRAAGNLFDLAGRKVAMSLPPGPWIGGRLAPEALVDATPTADAPQSPRVSGTQPWVTLACRFSDVAAQPHDLAYFGTMLSNQTGRLDHYWREVSYNKVNVAGSAAYGWFTLPHPRSYYVPASGSANLTALFNDCTAVADSTVNFASFVGVNTFYNDDLDGFAWGGSRYATLDGVSKVWYVTWEPPWGYANEAPLAHEMGHGFGLPHANNSDLDSDTYDNPWDVMSDSWHNAGDDATYGAQPKHIGIWSRDHLGWIDAARKLTVSTNGAFNGVVLDRANLIGSTHTQMIVVTLPASEPASHYYVIEARKRVGYYEASLAGDAVIIHEVKTDRDAPAWSVDASVPPANVSNNEGSMFKVGESWAAPGNAFTVNVVSATADGFVLNLQRGVVGDLIFKNGFDGVRLALFDLDGTLIDSELGIVNSIEYALAKLGAQSPPRSVLRGWIGPPLRATFPLALGADPARTEQAVEHYSERFTTVGWTEHTPYAGIGAVIEGLAGRGTRLAVVTSKVELHAGKIMRNLPFGAHFTRVYAALPGGRDSEKAAMIARALSDFGIAAEDAAMVGDRHFDIEGARANGVRSIGAGWGFGSIEELRDAGADAIAMTPAELPELLS